MPAPVGEVLRVANALMKRVVADEYKPGTRLPAEVDLATEFGCGRSTIREALRHMASLNLVQSRRGSGAVVLDFRREGVLDLMPIWFETGNFEHPLPIILREMQRMRAYLACEAARLAALYAKPESIPVLRKAVEAADAVRESPADHSLRELDLFQAMVQSSAIWPTVWFANALLRPMRDLNRMVAEQIGSVPGDWRAVMDELVDRIERRDADGASAHLRAHFERVDQRIERELQQILEMFIRGGL
jgi:GntR family transcriptional regulator, transcriptional repressor for pyruvate dehydrogenase complex